MFTLQNRFRIMLSFLLLSLLLLTWPGYLSPDSYSQWNMALNHVYSDHHPPMMSVLWSLFIPLYNTPGWIPLLHFIVLGIGIDYLARMKHYHSTYFVLCLPFIPQVLVYMACVWKDVGLAMSFFTVVCILSYHTYGKSKLTLGEKAGVILLLIYGSCVKYQGQFCVLPLCVWFFYNNKSWLKSFLKGLILFGCLLFFVKEFNHFFVPQTQKSHSWQYVKLFDLAAISAHQNQDLIPTSYRTQRYTFEKLKNLTNHQRVDDLVFGSTPILSLQSHEPYQQDLMAAWYASIKTYPLSYLRHRFLSVLYIYGSIPGYSHYYNFISPLKETFSLLFYILNGLGRLVGLVCVSHLLLPIFTGFYLYLGLKKRHTPYGPLLFFSSLTSACLMGILFFMSMAGTPRYTYLCALLMAHCHVIAFYMYQQKKGIQKIHSLLRLRK